MTKPKPRRPQMSDTVTLKVKKNPSDKEHTWTCVVKTEFLKKCPDPENYGCFDLNSKFFMYAHLHNPTGPAIVRHDAEGPKTTHGGTEYWLDGKCLQIEDKALADKIAHNAYFADKLEKTLES